MATSGAGRGPDVPRTPPELFEATVKPVLERTQELWAQVFGQPPGGEPLRRAFQDQIGRYLQGMNVATRADVEALRHDLAALEARVQRLEARPAARPSGARKRAAGRARRGAAGRRRA